MKAIKPIKNRPPAISLEDLNTNDIKHVKKAVLLDELKKQYTTRLQQENFDRDMLVATWLKQYSSKATRNTYGRGLAVFLEWLDITGKSIIALTSFDTDEYVFYVRQLYQKESTQRIRLASVVSFFKYLVRHGVLEHNVFYGIKWPKRLYGTKSADEIPQAEDLKIIEEQLRTELQTAGKGRHIQQAHRMIVVLSIIKNHGLRVGALPTLVIDRNMQFTAKSKGSMVSGVLLPEVKAILKEFSIDTRTFFTGLKAKTLQKSFERFCKKLVSMGLLHTVYSLHDIRHYAAVTHYTKHKDLIATQRFLGHSSVAITQTYLASLRCEC